MPKLPKLNFRQVLSALKAHDGRFDWRPGRGSHRILFHPDIHGEYRQYPVPCHRESDILKPGYLKSLIARFDLPHDFFG